MPAPSRPRVPAISASSGSVSSTVFISFSRKIGVRPEFRSEIGVRPGFSGAFLFTQAGGDRRRLAEVELRALLEEVRIGRRDAAERCVYAELLRRVDGPMRVVE